MLIIKFRNIIKYKYATPIPGKCVTYQSIKNINFTIQIHQLINVIIA